MDGPVYTCVMSTCSNPVDGRNQACSSCNQDREICRQCGGVGCFCTSLDTVLGCNASLADGNGGRRLLPKVHVTISEGPFLSRAWAFTSFFLTRNIELLCYESEIRSQDS